MERMERMEGQLCRQLHDSHELGMALWRMFVELRTTNDTLYGIKSQTLKCKNVALCREMCTPKYQTTPELGDFDMP
jgi:hypothetical protein